MAVKKWVPLESNPDVMTEFAGRIGLDTSRFAFHDVLGLDEELLAMVPQPVLAVLMLFPITPESEAATSQADAAAAAAAEEKGAAAAAAAASAPYYMKQTIGNACGTIAMLHAFGNSLQRLQLAPDTFLRTFFEATAAMAPAERGAYLEQPPDGAPDIEDAHKSAAEQGVTAPPEAGADVDLHFVALVEHDGQLWELDGRRRAPVAHGPTSPDTLLSDAARVARQFIARANSLNFNLIALASAS